MPSPTERVLWRSKMEDKMVAIELTVAEWNVVMNAIGQRPYMEVAGLITKVKSQADEQLAAPTAE